MKNEGTRLLIEALLRMYSDAADALADVVEVASGNLPPAPARKLIDSPMRMSDAELVRRVARRDEDLEPQDLIAAARRIDGNAQKNSLRTAINRLHKQGVLSRTRHGRGYRYRLS